MCPFVDSQDIRCANHWTMNNISQAYIHCVDRYSSCPIYRRLSEELLVQSCGQKHEEAAVLELASA